MLDDVIQVLVEFKRLAIGKSVAGMASGNRDPAQKALPVMSAPGVVQQAIHQFDLFTGRYQHRPFFIPQGGPPVQQLLAQFRHLRQDHGGKQIMGKAVVPVCLITHRPDQALLRGPFQALDQLKLALAGAFLEELIALGCRDFIACGGCGVLDKSIGLGHVVVPATAVRDEGTSYHYLPPSREVAAHPDAIQAIEQALQKHHVPYIIGKTWTTDGVYRETPTRIARRRDEGCHVVEMEAAAFFAIAQFRGVRFGQLLYGGDDLTGDAWDGRNWQKESSTRARLFQLAVEACLIL